MSKSTSDAKTADGADQSKARTTKSKNKNMEQERVLIFC